jgi:O-antigen/teichoic acid export membrane protein
MSEEYKNTAYTLSVIIGLGVSLLMVLSSGLIANIIVGEELKYPLMIMASTIFLNGMISMYLSWMNRQLHFLKAGLIRLISFVISSIIAIMMALYGYGFYGILFKAVASSLLTLLISILVVDTKFSFCYNRNYAKSIVNFGGWLTASVIVNNISAQIDRLMMSRLLSVGSLGAYNRPKEFIIQISTRINGIFDTTLFPILSNIQDRSDSLRNAYIRSQYFMNITAMVISLSLICNSTMIIRLFFGENWINLNNLFQLLTLTLLINTNGRLGDCYLRSLGLVRQQFNLRLFELFLNIVCILIGFNWGVIGVAIGFLFANAILVSVKTFYLSKEIDVSLNVVICNILGAWKFCVFFLPIIAFQHLFSSSSLLIDLLFCAFFVLLIMLFFLVFPSLIGEQYKNLAYRNVKALILSKVLKR